MCSEEVDPALGLGLAIAWIVVVGVGGVDEVDFSATWIESPGVPEARWATPLLLLVWED